MWEPGEWQPPRDATEPASGGDPLTPVAAGEPLAFALEPKAGGAAAECAPRVFDGTLSSRHLALRRDADG